jgi:Tol biopolymer transport system component
MSAARICIACIAAALVVVAGLARAEHRGASITRASVGNHGQQDTCGSPGRSPLSAHGRFVAFKSCGTNLTRRDPRHTGVFVRDLHRRTTKLVADGRLVGPPQLSRNARVVAYMGRSANGCTRGFVQRRGARRAKRLPLGRHDGPRNHLFVDHLALSPDGRYVVTISASYGSSCRHAESGDEAEEAHGDDFRLHVYDRRTGRTRRIFTYVVGGAELHYLVVSRKARVIVVGAEDYTLEGLYAVRRRSGSYTRVDVTSEEGVVEDALASGPSISDNGRFVAFDSWGAFSPNDVDDRRLDVYVRDLNRGRTTLVSVGTPHPADENSGSPDISADGRRVAFATANWAAPTPEDDGPWIFVRDRRTLTTTRASVDAEGDTHSPSFAPVISADGRIVSFVSPAAFVPSDTNGSSDTYVRRLP